MGVTYLRSVCPDEYPEPLPGAELIARLNEQLTVAREALGQLSALLESPSAWLLFVDLDGRLITCNANFAASFCGPHGTRPAPGAALEALIPRELAARWLPLHRRALTEGPVQSDFELPDGRVLQFTFNRVDKDGRPIGVSQFGVDITEAKRAEASLLESETRLRSCIDNSPVAVFLADEHGRFLQVNPAAERITGYTREALLARAIPDLVPPEVRAHAIGRFQELKDSGYARLETEIMREDGSCGFWSVEAVRLDPARFLGFASDITGRRKAEVERAALLDQLRQSQKMESLGVLAGGVAHDMNNVLAAILSLASAHLRIEPEGAPARAAFGTIRDAALRGG